MGDTTIKSERSSYGEESHLAKAGQIKNDREINPPVSDLTNQLHVLAGMDRFNQNNLMIWGLLPLSIKLSSKDTGGALLMFEHRDMRNGGPPRHVHYAQDEWFYVVQGQFAFEIGNKEYKLTAGDTLFAPRNIPHGWAHIGETPGTLLTMVSPVGTFEDFILDTTRHNSLPPQDEVEKTFLMHGMKVVGPPLIGANA